MLNTALQQLIDGERLERRVAREVLDHLLSNPVESAQVAALLALLQREGPAPEEIAGFADALAAAARPFPTPPPEAIDTCGTGGDGKRTFNISTTAAIVAAAAGAKVYKHGNRAATSRSGSADLLERWGVPVELSAEQSTRQAETLGFTFLYARSYHPLLAKLAPVRSTIGFPTIFNLLGPLLNPARVRRQVIGVYSERGQDLLSRALALRGTDHALVLHGAGGLDEATPLGPFRVMEVRGHQRSGPFERNPNDLGVKRCTLEELQVDGPDQSLSRANAVLDGAHGGCRDAVLLNAALALEVAGVASDWADGLRRATEALDDGAVRSLLDRLQTSAPSP